MYLLPPELYPCIAAHLPDASRVAFRLVCKRVCAATDPVVINFDRFVLSGDFNMPFCAGLLPDTYGSQRDLMVACQDPVGAFYTLFPALRESHQVLAFIHALDNWPEQDTNELIEHLPSAFEDFPSEKLMTRITYEYVRRRGYVYDVDIFTGDRTNDVFEGVCVSVAILCLPQTLRTRYVDDPPIISDADISRYANFCCSQRPNADPAPLQGLLGNKYGLFCSTVKRCAAVRAGYIPPGTRMSDLIRWGCVADPYFTLEFLLLHEENILYDGPGYVGISNPQVRKYLEGKMFLGSKSATVSYALMNGESPGIGLECVSMAYYAIKYKRFDVIRTLRENLKDSDRDYFEYAINRALYRGHIHPRDLL